MKCKLAFVAFLIALCANGQPLVSKVLNGASYSDVLAPGCWMAIFGSGFGSAPTSASAVPLPTLLGGISVKVDGEAAPLLYVSDQQINALIPFEVKEGDNRKITVVVTAAQGASASYTIALNRRAPALFTRDSSGTGLAHAFDSNFRSVDYPAAGDVIILYATGLGPTNPAASSAAGGSATEPLSRVTTEVEVFAGDQKVEVLFAGLAPGFPGVYQLNVRVPTLWTDRLYLRTGGWISNIAKVGLHPGNNVERVLTAQIPTALSPGSAPDMYTPNIGTSQSLNLYGAQFSLSLDVRPDSRPFVVAAVGEVGGLFTRIDTANGMWETFVTAPTQMLRAGDFSTILTQQKIPIMAFNLGCLQFPGAVVPAGLMDPWLPKVLTGVPQPTVVFDKYEMGVAESRGPFPAGTTRLTLSGNFIDVLQIPCGPARQRKTTFTIYVDGNPVATREVSFPVSKSW
jgi:uncharacterized protein (TIGR03437 family)